MNLPRDDRLDRQSKDWGDEQDTVYRLDSSNSMCYHGEADCHNLARGDDVLETTRAAAKRRWLAPCGVCVDLHTLPTEVQA